MITSLIFSAILLFIGIANLPIGYYTFLRIIVTISAVAILSAEIKNGLNFWVIIFGLISIVFNPILPVYLDNKSIWIPIDFVTAIFFLIKIFTLKQKPL